MVVACNKRIFRRYLGRLDSVVTECKRSQHQHSGLYLPTTGPTDMLHQHGITVKDFINTAILESGLTLLHYAVASGSHISVRTLGADVNVENVPV